jgi:VanZ family protein
MEKFIAFLQKHFASLYVPILWTIVVATLCCLPGSLLPNESHFKIPEFDKLVHICFFGGFVFLWSLYESGRISDPQKLLKAFFFFYVLGNVFGIGIEYIQKYWIPGRDYDLADIIADMIGAGLAYGASNLWLRRNPRI